MTAMTASITPGQELHGKVAAVTGAASGIGFASAQALAQLKHPALRHVVAAHLSEQNNQASLVRQTLAQALDWPEEAIGIASPTLGSDWYSL